MYFPIGINFSLFISSSIKWKKSIHFDFFSQRELVLRSLIYRKEFLPFGSSLILCHGWHGIFVLAIADTIFLYYPWYTWHSLGHVVSFVITELWFIVHVPQCGESPLVIRTTVLVAAVMKPFLKALGKGDSCFVGHSSRERDVLFTSAWNCQKANKKEVC